MLTPDLWNEIQQPNPFIMSCLPSCLASSWLFPSSLWSLKSFYLLIAPEKCHMLSLVLLFVSFFSLAAPSALNAFLPLCLANSFWSNRTQLRQSLLQEVLPDFPPCLSSSPSPPQSHRFSAGGASCVNLNCCCFASWFLSLGCETFQGEHHGSSTFRPPSFHLTPGLEKT